MKRTLGLLALLVLCCSAQSPSGMLSSSSAAYDGTALVLSGQVILDHGLGTMKAEEAVLEKQEANGKEFPFSSILLKSKVELKLPEQSFLQCESAALDFSSLKGKLSASEGNKVLYSDKLLRISSNESDLLFEKLENPGSRSDYTVKIAKALGDVLINYGDLFTVKAGKAIYQKNFGGTQLAQGTIHAFPTDEFSNCRIEHGNDVIDAEAIEMDLAHSAVILKKTKGSLTEFFSPKLPIGEVHFHCDQVLWDQPKNTFHLQGHVRIDESALGKLSNEEELVVVQGKNGIASILAKGSVFLEFQENENSPLHKLSCHGKMAIDHEKMQATFESPSVEGTTPLDKQLYYDEGKISVYADRAHIDYAAEGNKLYPSTISLKGHVRVRSIDASKPARVGLADWITYSPTTHTFILGSNPGNKVLFFDEKENMRICAQEIHLTQDSSGTNETVKGVGNVRFSFSAEEETLLKNLFGITK
jgi:lipopolysaccharide export system protein LptA